MSDFPNGYEFYDHHKGPPGGKIRHDVYLYGNASSRRNTPSLNLTCFTQVRKTPPGSGASVPSQNSCLTQDGYTT